MNTKICSKCRVEKSFSEFNTGTNKRDGLYCYCRECAKMYQRGFREKHRDKINSRAKELRDANIFRCRANERRSDFKTKYGLTTEKYEQLCAEQNNCCACCGDEFIKTPHIDHAHGSTPVVIRGLLCLSCNTGLGSFKDSLTRLKKAIGYLQQFS